jgi:signal transduction histidine kinase
MERKPDLLKFFFPVFYTAAFLFVVLNAWNIQSEVRRGSGELYRNLRESPAYVKKGFNRAELAELIKDPSESADWVRYSPDSPARRIINSPLPDLPKRTYLSPFGKPTEEFTIAFVIEMSDKDLALINGSISITPGFYFAGIGENWEIFLNGRSIYVEMHLDKNNQIKTSRSWRDVHFPADSLLFVPGTNILAVRIVGDPSCTLTGPHYNTAPIYMDDYRIIEKRQYHFLLIVLSGICIFTGVYHLLLFFSARNKKEIFNLFFGIFSFLLCIYAITRNGVVNYLIPNTNITIRLEYLSLILMIPVFGLFIETLVRGTITKISRGYLLFCSVLALSQTLFCNQYGEDIIYIWNVTAMIYYGYIIFHIISYFRNRRKENDDIPINSILIGTIASYFCGIHDIFDALFIRSGFNLFQYSIFVIHIGMLFALSQRFGAMYKRLEQSNTSLELTVQERTEKLEEQAEIVLKVSKDKSELLAAMSDKIRTQLNEVIDLSEAELRGDLPESSKNNITQIYLSGLALLETINEIMDISKIESDDFTLHPAEYETAPLISNVVNLNRIRIGSKPIYFMLEINRDFPQKLMGDELRVKQILNSLLSNAIKYTKEGTVTLSVSSIRGPHVRLSFSVRDTGIGIRADDIEKLFSGNTQIDTTAVPKSEGPGLNLEVTKKLVEMMGGAISVKSEYGKGSSFTVTLMQMPAGSEDIGEETAEELRRFSYGSTQTSSQSGTRKKRQTRQ